MCVCQAEERDRGEGREGVGGKRKRAEEKWVRERSAFLNQTRRRKAEDAISDETDRQLSVSGRGEASR